MNKHIDITNVVLTTDRLILRPWKETDLEDFYEYASIEGLGQMAGWLPHKSIAESKTILGLFIRSKKVFAIELKETGKVFAAVLEDAGVYKNTPAGKQAFARFVEFVNHNEK